MTVNPCSPGYVGTVLCDNPVQFYELNETGGTTAFDWSSSRSNGTYSGPVTFGATPAPVAGDNSAISMPGSNGTLTDVSASLPNPGFTSGTSWTLETWIYPILPANNYDTADQTVWGISASQRFLYQQSQKLLLQLGAVNCTSTATVQNRAWSMVDVVYNATATQVQLYINGQADASCTVANSAAALNAAYYLGEYANNNIYYKWSGYLGMHAAYSKALTAAQITKHYNAKTTTPLTSQIALMQIFDETSNGTISTTAAAQDGPRYDFVWGPYVANAPNWVSQAPALHAAYYVPMETDASTTNWGAIGQSLTWWQAHNPTWIEYACDTSDQPTMSVAHQAGWPNQVPLDFSNPDVQQYQFQLWTNFAASHSYNSIAADEVLPTNSQVQGTGASYLYDCGHYDSTGTFVRQYQDPRSLNGSLDTAWTNDTIAWVTAYASYLRTNKPAFALAINTYQEPVDSSTLGTFETSLLSALGGAPVAYALDEAGISDYGTYGFSHGTFLRGVTWAQYAQQHNIHVLMNEEFQCPGTTVQPPDGKLVANSCTSSSQVSSQQREYGIAGYLMADFGKEDLMAGPSTEYGREMYYQTEYTTNYGIACAAMSSSDGGHVYARKYSNALVLVNADSWETQSGGTWTNTAPASYTLPKPASSFTDLEGRTISSPLSIAAGDAYVLLTTNGCN